MKRNPGGALVGPSIPLAMMASGMNDKFYVSWLFTYWKDEKRASFKTLKISFEQNQSQIFIETPYRNNKLLEDFKPYIQKHLCIATDITCQQNISRPRKLRPGKETIFTSSNHFYNP
jgi:16S rRNA (cytidine1402-2'-O)-methyltransferase